ncbi:MAG: recO [Candidatus Saccharibacteria bacterium]|jgi:DNA repair protein RecO (recombination protein O)|nr:recO [Candidatus Saccharibacteria bacterium]
MPTYQTTGIVIGRTNFGEADRIIRFLTADHGKVSAVAKGVRRIKSRTAGHLELFGEASLTLATGRNLDVVTAARLSWYPHQLIAAYDRIGLAYAMAAAVDRLTEPGHPQPKLYALLSEALHAVDGGATGALVELWFKLRFLEVQGYRPDLTACVICGRHDQDAQYFFDAARGGIVCQNDSSSTSRPLSQPAIKLWRLLSDYPYVTVAQIADGPALATATLLSCDEFYEHHLGRSFKPGLVT